MERRPTEGTVIAVNEAAHLVSHDYFMANDGFINTLAHVETQAIRVCRRRHLPTLPGGKWFALDGIGVTTGIFTIRCAFLLAVHALKANRIVLIGNDMTPGAGTGTLPWKNEYIELARKQLSEDLSALVRDHGVCIEHVRWNGEDIFTETHEPIKAAIP
jgi:hypothetical protein